MKYIVLSLEDAKALASNVEVKSLSKLCRAVLNSGGFDLDSEMSKALVLAKCRRPTSIEVEAAQANYVKAERIAFQKRIAEELVDAVCACVHKYVFEAITSTTTQVIDADITSVIRTWMLASAPNTNMFELGYDFSAKVDGMNIVFSKHIEKLARAELDCEIYVRGGPRTWAETDLNLSIEDIEGYL